MNAFLLREVLSRGASVTIIQDNAASSVARPVKQDSPPRVNQRSLLCRWQSAPKLSHKSSGGDRPPTLRRRSEPRLSCSEKIPSPDMKPLTLMKALTLNGHRNSIPIP
uniref:Uncharacterized protein n=1 Tax=Amphora coffeiformis TaxID=265554 RepID=A0A7S3P7F5_9STRA